MTDQPTRMSAIQIDQHRKEVNMNLLNLPMEVIDIIKSYSFYDIKSAGIIKKAKEQRSILNQLVTEVVFSNYIHTKQLELLEASLENMIFTQNYWAFGFSGHSTETIQLQGVMCLSCGDYETDIYPDCIRCKCENYYYGIPSDFA